ncbi:PorP/SprF family type IX secretion system membrane protein [Marinoscillum sp.]|uniref:PorP/SprF family type IX secretion system membrane protein n=1 Tax=Marinoscillum sp. TaxID=2024838 RepID=UPI003BA9E160
MSGQKKHIASIIRGTLIVLFITVTVSLRAQQTSLYAHYYLNPYLYNPAMAGYGDQSSAYFLYRRQWAGVDGAPETQVFTLDGNLKNHPVGLGVTFMNDVTNILGRTGGAITGSYEAGITSTQSLRFGLSFQALRNRVFFDRIRAEDVSDPNLLQNVDSKTIFEGSVGVSYNVKNLRIGFSGEQLFQNTFKHDEQAAFRSLNYTLVRHFYTAAEYLFEINDKVTIKPQLFVRTVQGLRSQFDGYVQVTYRDFVWANLIYRHDIGGGASFGFKLDDQYVVSYAYEFPTSDLNIIGSSTHEFVLGIKIHRPHQSKTITTAEGRELIENTAHQEKIDALVQHNEHVSGKLNRTERQIETQNQELDRLREVVESYQKELNQAIQKLEASAADTTSKASSFYVVVGALREFDNAKAFQRILKREADLDTRVIQNAGKTWYFIYSHDTDSVSEALKQLDKIKSGPAMPYIIEQPWIYKKEE